jgi:hypothetical protein
MWPAHEPLWGLWRPSLERRQKSQIFPSFLPLLTVAARIAGSTHGARRRDQVQLLRGGESQPLWCHEYGVEMSALLPPRKDAILRACYFKPLLIAALLQFVCLSGRLPTGAWIDLSTLIWRLAEVGGRTPHPLTRGLSLRSRLLRFAQPEATLRSLLRSAISIEARHHQAA